MMLNSRKGAKYTKPHHGGIKWALFVVAICALLAQIGYAFAQLSPSFNLGWSIVASNGGGEQQSANFRVQSAFGQLAAGNTASTNFDIVTGFVQDALGEGTQPPTPTPNPNARIPDTFETDNECATAAAIAATGAPQTHNFHENGDADWVRFDGVVGTPYRIEVQIPVNSIADVVLEIYSDCAAGPDDSADDSFTPGVRLDFKTPANGPVYVKLANFDPNVGGNQVAYQISVRNLQEATAPDSGALILLAGRLRANDRLQTNIHNAIQEVYSIFKSVGYDDEHIQLLATDSALAGYDNGATTANFEDAIINWAAPRVGSQKLLTIYMIDHGEEDLFYVDELNDQRLTPAQIDGWLDQLEAAVPEVRVNIFIEACNSGSFIEGEQSVSGARRVIVTSTNVANVAYASENGAYFSDHFFTALRQGHHLFGGYWEASASVKQTHEEQQPLVDGNGNGAPNEESDFLIASQRSFFVSPTPIESNVWPPYIVKLEKPTSITEGAALLQAQVRDDIGVKNAWAIIYPPSYQPPATSRELIPEGLEKVPLTKGENELFAGEYRSFTEPGVYRIIFHAEDDGGLRARPATLRLRIGAQLFLPLIRR